MPFISRSRWGIRPLAALTIAVLLTLLSSSLVFASPNVVTLVKLSHDPYTNTSSQHKTQVEPDNFSYGSTIVAVTQSGRFIDGGSSNIGWATSTNNGATWTHGFLPGTTVYATPAGKLARVSDPAVAYDAKHSTWLISSLGLLVNSGGPFGAVVLVSQSTNGGLSWNNPVAVASTTTQFFDKDWIVCDDTSTSPFYSNCYAEWDNAANGDLVLMSTSSNGGNTWSVAKSTANGAGGLGGQPLVQPNGTVIVPFEANAGTISAFRSTNGGASWNGAVIVATIRVFSEKANIRTGPLPSAEIDGSGRVYVVWQDCRFESSCSANDIVMTTSSDGVTWSAVTRIPADPVGSGIDHMIPGIAVDKSTSGSTAHLAVAFYYLTVANCTVGCMLDVGFVSSTDGGTTWTSNMQLAGPMQLSWLAATNQGQMVGDYISTEIIGGKAFPVFAVARPPSTGGVLNEALYTVAGGLSAAAGSNVASSGGVVFSSSTAGAVRLTAF